MRQQRRQRCGRSKSPEKRGPQSAITGMLIDQNPYPAAAAQQLDHFPKPFAALKNLKPKSAARFANVPIDMRIADALINRRGSLTARKMGEEARTKFPRTNVAQE